MVTKCRKKKFKLMWELKPALTVHVDDISNSSVLLPTVVPRRSPRKRKLNSGKLPFFIQ